MTNTLDIIKRAILEGKLDTELGISDGDVVKRFDIVRQLLLDTTVPTVPYTGIKNTKTFKTFSDEVNDALKPQKVTDHFNPPYWVNNPPYWLSTNTIVEQPFSLNNEQDFEKHFFTPPEMLKTNEEPTDG